MLQQQTHFRLSTTRALSLKFGARNKAASLSLCVIKKQASEQKEREKSARFVLEFCSSLVVEKERIIKVRLNLFWRRKFANETKLATKQKVFAVVVVGKHAVLAQ